MDTEIRKADQTEITVIIETLQRTIRASFTGFLGEEEVGSFIESGGVERFATEYLDAMEVLLLNGVIIGFVVTKENAIDLLMVDCDHHGNGYGSRLLEHAENELFEKFDQLRVDSFRDNTGANSFYQIHGWIEEKEFFDPEYGIPMKRFAKSRGAERSSRRVD